MTDAAGAEALQEASDGFFLAAEYGRSDVIKALADHGRGQIDLAAVVDPATGRSPLHVAVANGKTDALRVLLAAGFPPDVAAHAEGNQAKTAVEGDAPQTRKQTAYALAQQLAATDLVMVFHQFLIQQVASNNVAGVEQMLAAGVDVTVTDGASSSSLLHWAVSCQASDVLAYLLTRQDVQDQRLVNRRNCDGATPLHLAAHGNQPDCVRLLLDAEADTQLLGEKGFSNGKPAVELTTAPAVLELFNQKTMVHGGSEETISEIEVPTQANEGSNILGDACGQDGAVCEHAGQVGKLEHQLEEKDLLINQLKKSIEDLVLESQEIQKLGEERVMLDYVRKLREDKTLVQRQLEDANEYIAIQQEQIQDLKTQIKLLCDGKQVSVALVLVCSRLERPRVR